MMTVVGPFEVPAFLPLILIPVRNRCTSDFRHGAVEYRFPVTEEITERHLQKCAVRHDDQRFPCVLLDDTVQRQITRSPNSIRFS